MKKTNKKGFTLVEIMIVVAIIGLLAAIGIPSIMGAYATAQEKTRERNITDVEKAKAMMTLPSAAGGQDLTIGASVSEADIIDALNLKTIDTIKTVGTYTLTINPIGTRATY